MDELDRRARLHGWFVTQNKVAEQLFWQWRRVSEPEDERHPIFRSRDEARAWMDDLLRQGAVGELL
jgi:hypothetical protein